MQLTGSQFTATTATMGNDLSTLPDFPAEIRAPAGTLAGVSGFQIQFASEEVFTPGDKPDVLVAMNPAALKVHLRDVPKGGTIVLNTDPYTYLGSRPLSLAPEATLDRGLCVVAVRTMSFGPMMGLVGGLVRGVDLRDDPRIHTATDLESVDVVGHSPFPHQLDGDHLGDADALHFRWEPDALRLVMPLAT